MSDNSIWRLGYVFTLPVTSQLQLSQTLFEMLIFPSRDTNSLACPLTVWMIWIAGNPNSEMLNWLAEVPFHATNHQRLFISRTWHVSFLLRDQSYTDKVLEKEC